MDQIDIKKQSEEIGIDVQALLSLYNLFTDQTETDMNQLKVLISEKNAKEVKDIAHHIKGACLNLELLSMVEQAKEMEKLAISEDWETLLSVHSLFSSDLFVLKEMLSRVEHE
ncbi:MAG: Hpt domain-containing protein [Spirochaetaceae bacterium]|nr:Hpt domain-containing protein [Spirochaetaceae bacterium]